MPKLHPWTRNPQSAFDVALIDLSLFAQAARADGDMSNYYRFLQVQRESRLIHLVGKGGPAQRGPRAAAGRGGAPRSGDEARRLDLMQVWDKATGRSIPDRSGQVLLPL